MSGRGRLHKEILTLVLATAVHLISIIVVYCSLIYIEAHTVNLVPCRLLIFRVSIVNDRRLHKLGFRLQLPARGEVHHRPPGRASYLLAFRTSSLLILLSIDVVLLVFEILQLHLLPPSCLLLLLRSHLLEPPLPLLVLLLHLLLDTLYLVHSRSLLLWVLLSKLQPPLLQVCLVDVEFEGLTDDHFIRGEEVLCLIALLACKFVVSE